MKWFPFVSVAYDLIRLLIRKKPSDERKKLADAARKEIGG